MNYIHRYREAAGNLALLREQYHDLTKRYNKLEAKCILSDNSHNRLFMAYEEALELKRIELASHCWMHDFSTGRVPFALIKSRIGHKVRGHALRELYEGSVSKTRLVQVKALTILFHLYGLHLKLIARFFRRGFRTMKKYLRRFRREGVHALLRSQRKCPRKADNPHFREMLFSVLHCPPAAFGINRTTWTQKLLAKVMTERGYKAGHNTVAIIIKSAGYKFRKAREVLTSNDPNYRPKPKKITGILSHLGPRDRFFSIDEFGPFAVKQKGGRRWVPPGEYPSFPQWQRSKGCLIITAALELSTNQVTYFYSSRKDSMEMIKLMDLLLEQYRGCIQIYLSWDAASWHASKIFLARVKCVNNSTYRRVHGTPLVKLTPLPARAQFLNVIESIFGGMAIAIIHNSDYASVDHAKAAIDRYFLERNEHFLKHPKRAGNKIWGKEFVAPTFREGQNCKYSRWR